MNSLDGLANSLHLDYQRTDDLVRSISAWDELLTMEAGRALPERWTLAVSPSLRSATVAASTGIEGNPLSIADVRNVLAGGLVDDGAAQREVVNYNEAMNMVTLAARQESFEPTPYLLQLVNGTITRGTPTDTRGEYRLGPVTVADFYSAPNAAAVPGLVTGLARWWRDNREHELIQAAVVHINLAAIHPWDDGNGRTARVGAALELMRSRVSNPDVINLESYFRAHRDEYFELLASTLGPTYQPDRHPITDWIEYYASVSVDRLLESQRLFRRVREDMGVLLAALDEVGDPHDWAPILLAANLYPLQAQRIAHVMGRSAAAVRATLAAMVRDGWLRREGRTRGTRYFPGARLTQSLRSPAMLDRFSEAEQLETWPNSWTDSSNEETVVQWAIEQPH